MILIGSQSDVESELSAVTLRWETTSTFFPHGTILILLAFSESSEDESILDVTHDDGLISR